MKVLRVVLTLVVALLIACSAMAAEKKKGRRGGGPAGDRIKALLDSLNLTDEQKTKIADINKEFDPKVAEARKKMSDVLTDEQKKKRADAEKEAKDAGKSPREVQAAAREAVQLSDEQKSKMAEAVKGITAIERERLEKIKGVLTAEQKEQLEKRMEEMKKGGRKKKAD